MQDFKKIVPLQKKNPQPELGGYDLLGKTRWNNTYPIILVHGFTGWSPDESPFFGDYWKAVQDIRLNNQK